VIARLCLVLLLAVPPAALPAQASHATTCSGAAPEDMAERFELFAADADAIVIAEITASTELPPGSALTPMTIPVSTATFRSIAILAQNQPITEFTVGPLRDTGPDCSGGPRLKAGDKALLFLIREQQYKVAYWRVGVFGDTVLFRGGDAVYAHAFDGVFEPAGSAREVIETILDVTAPPPDIRQAALAFLASLPPPSLVVAPSPTTVPPAAPAPISPPDTGNAGLR
jgi:hypothetical protein